MFTMQKVGAVGSAMKHLRPAQRISQLQLKLRSSAPQKPFRESEVTRVQSPKLQLKPPARVQNMDTQRI